MATSDGSGMRCSGSLAASMAAAENRASGFDYLRITLALAITCCHGVVTSYGPSADAIFWHGAAKPFYRLMLPMFFALSGFLVAGSLGRCRSLVGFLGLRLIRIYPALAVETLLSALVIGPLLSTLAPAEYLRDPLFARYLWNAVGDVHFTLPGVFSGNPLPGVVNGQLWTVPYELGCYVALAALVVVGIGRRRALAPVATALVLVVFVAAKLARHGGVMPTVDAALPGPLLLASFLAGVSLYLYRAEVPHDPRLFAGALAGALALLGAVPYGEYLAPLLVAYVTVYLGLLDPARLRIIGGADLSYGVFLYSFPIQQAVCGEWAWARHWAVNLAVCVPLSLGVAALSWTLVERPALRLRGFVKGCETWLLDRRLVPVSQALG